MKTDFKLDPADFGLTFPFQSVFGIGRNYAQHAVELGNAIPQTPVIFLKPTTAICKTGSQLWIPKNIGQIDHEVELVVCLGKGGRDIDEKDALDHVAAYAVGIDVTARDLQSEAKKKGLPWEVCKGYDTFAPLSGFISAEEAGHGPFTLTLRINGEVRQSGSTDEMIFSLPKLIVHLSQIFTLRRGDLIFTGTPKGVGPIAAGDTLKAEMSGTKKHNSILALEVRAVEIP